MKNQYCADIGDYGKYGLLRCFSINYISVGINWYLTENDGSSDGKFVSYLDNPHERVYDCDVFDALRFIVKSGGRSVDMVKKSGIIPKAVFYDDILNTNAYPYYERKGLRHNWHIKALNKLKGCNLVFLDPDNGPIGSKSPASKDAEKYVLPEEIADYYNSGCNVVYYCQKARRTKEQWYNTKHEMCKFISDGKIITLTYHRGTQRSYIFVIHNEDYPKYEDIILKFLGTEWGRIFTKE